MCLIRPCWVSMEIPSVVTEDHRPRPLQRPWTWATGRHRDRAGHDKPGSPCQTGLSTSSLGASQWGGPVGLSWPKQLQASPEGVQPHRPPELRPSPAQRRRCQPPSPAWREPLGWSRTVQLLVASHLLRAEWLGHHHTLAHQPATRPRQTDGQRTKSCRDRPLQREHRWPLGSVSCVCSHFCECHEAAPLPAV